MSGNWPDYEQRSIHAANRLRTDIRRTAKKWTLSGSSDANYVLRPYSLRPFCTNDVERITRRTVQRSVSHGACAKAATPNSPLVWKVSAPRLCPGADNLDIPETQTPIILGNGLA